MFAKVLVANRGEIAIRAFRAAYELGRADGGGLPVRGPQLRAPAQGRRGLRDRRARPPGPRLPRTRRRSSTRPCAPVPTRSTRATASSRRTRTWPRPARAPASRSSAPAPRCSTLTGNKARAIAAARAAGVPTLQSVGAGHRRRTRWWRRRADDAVPAVRQGRRRRWRSRHAPGRRPGTSCGRRSRPACARPRARSATRRSSSSRPWSTRGTSRCRSSPTATGNVIHLFERDCSVQRRHQKVVEIAPAPNLDPALRERMCADAVRFAREIGYVNAGTVEFLLDAARRLRLHRDEPADPGRAHGDRGGHRRRPRAGPAADRVGGDAGRPRPRPGRHPAARRGAAVPDHHRGPGQRVPPRHRRHHDVPLARRRRRSGSTAVRRTPGAEVSAHFDSMLTKLTCRGRDFATAVTRARRAVAEFRIRGVATNIPFLQAVLDDPDFRGRAGDHVVHRRPPAAAHRPLERRPRHRSCSPTSPT